MKLRGTILRQLAERAAAHPRIEAAVVGAIRAELPAVLETLIAEEAERQGGHVLRLYGRRLTSERRTERDTQVAALLREGRHPSAVAVEVGCSRRHVYYVRAKALP